VIFWQRMFSPHMMGLAEAMAENGHDVTFIATEHLSKERREQGWQVAAKGMVKRRIIANSTEAGFFIAGLNPSTLHITQGLRGNAEIGVYQELIISRGQRLWVVMETVDPGGWRAPFKKAIYGWEIWRKQKQIEGILAIGAGTAEWLTARNFPIEKVFPFAYFINPTEPDNAEPNFPEAELFTFAYVGNLEPWKNPKLALEAFMGLPTGPRRLIVAGGGSLRPALETRARQAPLEAQIDFLGRLPMTVVPTLLKKVDCLLLPSNTDGWGVVASEAMLMGTPTIVSDACGVRGAVHAAPQGSVFPARDLNKLQTAMAEVQAQGRNEERRASLKAWAATLGANFGAEYLQGILSGSLCKTVPDWLRRGVAS
tara:strand:+ start:5743 stop:6849 length:1107 start_codon:yes stop_codon:yes gene_type:complete